MDIYFLGFEGKRFMKIAVCDDDRAIREELIRLIQKQVSDVEIKGYQSGEELKNAGKDYDIDFLDIEMGTVSGMDTAKYIRGQEKKQPEKKHHHFCDRASGIYGGGV